MRRCPIHGVELRQLGDTAVTNRALADGQWVGLNLWNCPDCKWPVDPKVFMVTKRGLVKAEA